MEEGNRFLTVPSFGEVLAALMSIILIALIGVLLIRNQEVPDFLIAAFSAALTYVFGVRAGRAEQISRNNGG